METGWPAERENASEPGAGVDQATEQVRELYLRLRSPVFRYVRRFAADDDEAGELTARTFERALTHLSSYRGDGDDLAAWLFRIARNQAIDAARRRRPIRPLDLLRAEQHPHSRFGRPEPELIQREESRELAERVQQLTPLQRECLVLRYGAGLSARQIGVVIGKTEAATQKQIGRALSRLREMYA